MCGTSFRVGSVWEVTLFGRLYRTGDGERRSEVYSVSDLNEVGHLGPVLVFPLSSPHLISDPLPKRTDKQRIKTTNKFRVGTFL